LPNTGFHHRFHPTERSDEHACLRVQRKALLVRRFNQPPRDAQFKHRLNYPGPGAFAKRIARSFPRAANLSFPVKRLIVFALNGALAQGRAPIDTEMADLLGALNEIVKVAIISGADWKQFERRVLAMLTPGHPRHQLTLLPVCGTQLYRFSDHWGRIYTRDFSEIEREKIVNALEKTVEMMSFELGQIWGPLIEDRGSQLTYSGLGQLAPIPEKRKWDPDCKKRRRMKAFLDQFIPEYSVHLGGMTSIDVTKPGLDKGYGIRQLRDSLGVPIQEMLFIGNTSVPGGNDLAAVAAGIHTIGVKDPEQTKRVIDAIIAMVSDEANPAPPARKQIPFPAREDTGGSLAHGRSAAPFAEPGGRGLAGERHAAVAREIRQTLASYAELKDVLARCAWERIMPEARLSFAGALRVERHLPGQADSADPFAGLAERLASLQEALDGCERILLAQMHGAIARAGFIGGQIASLQPGAASA
jgi:hydroxymethylpyrimidine pyrophosphatase-like HAD family hydrolase